MGKRCVVYGCNGAGEPGIRLFSFPEGDLEMLMKWLENLQMSKSTLNTASKVCSKHFDPLCMGDKFLCKGAIPTLNLGRDDLNLNYPIIYNRESIRVCCVETCGSSSSYFNLHKFPNNPEKRRAWIEACGLHQRTQRHSFICNKHFDQAQVKPTKRLTNDAFPLLNINENEDAFVVNQELPECESLPCENCKNYCKLADYNRKQWNLVKNELAEERNKIKAKMAQIANLNRKIELLEKEITDLNNESSISTITPSENVGSSAIEFARIITNNKRVLYTETQKELFQAINLQSTRGYRFMRDQLKFHLPSPSALYGWRPVKKAYKS